MYISWLLCKPELVLFPFSSEIDEEGKFNRTLNQLRVPELISRFAGYVIVFGDVERLRFKVPYTITNPI
jgi:hypothetical protein